MQDAKKDALIKAATEARDFLVRFGRCGVGPTQEGANHSQYHIDNLTKALEDIDAE